MSKSLLTDENDAEALSETLRALADSSRRVQLIRLAAGPATSGQLAELLRMSRPAGSQHLSVLVNAGLVDTTPTGRQRWHELPDRPALRSACLAGRAHRNRGGRRLGADLYRGIGAGPDDGIGAGANTGGRPHRDATATVINMTGAQRPRAAVRRIPGTLPAALVFLFLAGCSAANGPTTAPLSTETITAGTLTSTVPTTLTSTVAGSTILGIAAAAHLGAAGGGRHLSVSGR